jgi:peptide/nickel transport system substrate-binding protein
LLDQVSAAELDQHPFNRAPIGTGLFMLNAAKSKADRLVLDANPYHRLWEKTRLDHVEFRFYSSHEHALAAYESGEVMGVSGILAEDMPRARVNPDMRLLSARLSGLSLIVLNLDSADAPFFQDQSVRQALLYGLDRQGLIDEVLSGQGLVLDSPIMPQSWAYDEKITTYTYDPEKAIALLVDAGWALPDDSRRAFEELSAEDVGVRTKLDVRLEFTLVTHDIPDRVALAHAVAEQWEEIGARVHVQPLSLSDLTLEYLDPREFDAALVQLKLPVDPDPYPLWHSTQVEGGQNYGGFVDRDADEAIEVARMMTDQGRRAELYRQFQEVFAERVPALLLYQPIYTFGVDRQVRNVQIAPMPDPSGRFRSIWQWEVLEKELSLSELNDQLGDRLDKRSDP